MNEKKKAKKSKVGEKEKLIKKIERWDTEKRRNRSLES